MSVKLVLKALAVGLMAVAVAAPAMAQRDRDRDRDDRRGGDHRGDKWELLGSQKVRFRGERDKIRVGRREGRFESLVLSVKDGDVEIREMTVNFVRGAPQKFTVNGIIKEGQRTRPIDLRGGDRAIESIDFVYRSVGRWRRDDRALVEVYGLKDDRRGDNRPSRPGWGGRPEWVELGCQSVALFGADRDVIRIGRREGRFKSIKFRAEGQKIFLLNAKVVYSNGQPDDLRVQAEIPKGGETQPISVRGRTRSIDRIEVVSAKRPSLKRVNLCAYGLQ